MTNQQAIERIKYRIETASKLVGLGINEDSFEDLKMAIKALEKQLPKKGIKEKITEGVNKGLHKFYCPVCYRNGDLRNKCNVGEYCSDCGQKIDWRE